MRQAYRGNPRRARSRDTGSAPKFLRNSGAAAVSVDQEVASCSPPTVRAPDRSFPRLPRVCRHHSPPRRPRPRARTSTRPPAASCSPAPPSSSRRASATSCSPATSSAPTPPTTFTIGSARQADAPINPAYLSPSPSPSPSSSSSSSSSPSLHTLLHPVPAAHAITLDLSCHPPRRAPHPRPASGARPRRGHRRRAADPSPRPHPPHPVRRGRVRGDRRPTHPRRCPAGSRPPGAPTRATRPRLDWPSSRSSRSRGPSPPIPPRPRSTSSWRHTAGIAR